MKSLVIGTISNLQSFFTATQFFQSSLGNCWLIDSSRQVTHTCYAIKESENVKNSIVILRTIAIAAGCHFIEEGFEQRLPKCYG